MSVMPPKRKNTYEVHLYLPEWMRDALRTASDQQRWSINTALEVATEEWLRSKGFERPETVSEHEREKAGRRKGEPA